MKRTLFSLLGLFAALWVSAQEVTVRGVVQDALGPVIGAHTGPGMMAVIHWGNRNHI